MASGAGLGLEGMRRHFLAQAEGCLMLGSTFTAGLCGALAAVLDDSTETGRRVLGWPGDARADALSLRLCGALHALVLSGADKVLASAFPPRSAAPRILAGLLPGVIRKHDAQLSKALHHPPQTNEVARAAMLLPGFLLLARETKLPLALHEIGASAGLNGLFERFHYSFNEDEWGEGEAAVRLRPEVRGPNRVPLGGRLKISSSEASDIAPVRISNPEERLRLRSFVWPDQTARLERLDAAIALATRTRLRPPQAKSAPEAVAEWLSARREGVASVLFHSIMWQYLPLETKRATVAAMAAAGARASDKAPLAWLRMEPPDASASAAALSLTLWPGGATRHLADCDYHGRWIAWR